MRHRTAGLDGKRADVLCNRITLFESTAGLDSKGRQADIARHLHERAGTADGEIGNAAERTRLGHVDATNAERGRTSERTACRNVEMRPRGPAASERAAAGQGERERIRNHVPRTVTDGDIVVRLRCGHDLGGLRARIDPDVIVVVDDKVTVRRGSSLYINRTSSACMTGRRATIAAVCLKLACRRDDGR